MRSVFVLTLLALLLTACGASTIPQPSITPTRSATNTSIPFTPSPPPTLTSSPTLTATAAITLTPTISPTPTFAFPGVTVNKQAHCRYGPSVAYLHAADLYPGDNGTVRGRHPYSPWLYIKFDKLNYFCWVAPSVVDVWGDISTVRTTEPNIETIGVSLYGPPKHVTAMRSGSDVTISWDQVEMTHDQDRGYFIEAFVCQDGNYLWWTFSYPDQFTTTYTVRDEAGCPEASYVTIYTATKEGYSKGKPIPWPAP
jgi:hypothetical protein